LLVRGLREDYAEAFSLLTDLAEGSFLFLDALELLEQFYELPGASACAQGPARARRPFGRTDGSWLGFNRPPLPPELTGLAAVARRVRPFIEFVDRTVVSPLMPDPRQARRKDRQLAEELEITREQLEKATVEAEQLRAQINNIETSKFWKLRKLWLRLKHSVGLGR
jgi:hypothetical protein